MASSTWDDSSPWEELSKPGACPICLADGPNDVLVELPATWITAGSNAPLPGYACVVSKRHVVEPFELPERDLRTFWDEAMFAARVLKRLFSPRKLNYEIPHLHMHLFPRYVGDPFVGGPIDFLQAGFSRMPVELERMREAFETALGEE